MQLSKNTCSSCDEHQLISKPFLTATAKIINKCDNISVVKDMYAPEEIKSYMNGVHGVFLMVKDVPTFSDFDMKYLSKTVYYLRRFMEENRGASRLYVCGQKRDVVVYLDDQYTMGVMVSKNINIHLLHRIVNKMFSHLKSSIEEKTLP